MARNPDITAIADYGGDFQQALFRRFYDEFSSSVSGIKVYPGVKNKLTLTKIVIGKGAKPYSGNFVSRSTDISYEPRVLEVKDCQRDLQIEPKKYRPTWQAQRRGSGENAKNKTIPFAQFVWESVIVGLKDEVLHETIWHGVGTTGFVAFDAGDTYAVGDLITFTQDNELRYFRCIATTTAGQSPDTHAAKWEWAGARALCVGFGKLISDAITAGDLVTTVTGAVSSSNAYDKFTLMWRALPDAIRLAGGVILCSMDDYDALTDDYENKVSKNFETIDGITYLAKTNRKCVIMPCAWMAGTRRLIATAPDNLIMGTDDLNDMNVIETEPHIYTINAGITWVMGFQIRDFEAMAVSDQS